MSQPAHYLIGIEEVGLRIGSLGFAGERQKKVAIVDIGRAKSIPDAMTKAIAKYAKANGVNPILLNVTDARVAKVAPTLKVDKAFSLDLLAEKVGQGNVAQMGCLTVKVRRA